VVLWTSDTGIDGENPVDLDELDLILIDPLPCHAWYQNMADFADGISDRAAGRSLSRTLNGKGAFRRFRNELHERHPELISCLAVPGRGQSQIPIHPLAGGAGTARGRGRSAVRE